MGQYSFNKDAQDEAKLKAFLKANDRDKKIFSKALKKEVLDIGWVEGNHKEFDHTIVLANGEFTAEWKMDLLCRNTGNCFVEYWCRGKDSGIHATTSDYWAQVIFSKVYPGKVRFGIWKTPDFVELTKTRMFREGVPGGDKWRDGPNGRAAVGYLVKEFRLFDSDYLLVDKKVDARKFLKATGIVL